MKPQTLSLILVLFLVACAPAVQAPTQTSTTLPISTSTPTPPPTVTPTSTPEAWVAIAEEYNMPPEQAKKLEGMNVTFERWSKNVDGVLVKNEAGQDAFWYEPQTEFLVAVDRWPVVTDIHQFEQNQIAEREILSDEFFAWVKYVVSKSEDGIGPDEGLFPNATSEGKMAKWNDSVAPFLINYPGLVNEGITYGDLATGESNDNREYRVIVSAYEYKGKKYPVVLISYYSSIYGTDEGRAKGLQMLATMQRRPIITGYLHFHDGSEDLLVKKGFANLGEGGISEAMEKMESGDPTLVSQPGVVFMTFFSQSEVFGN